MQKRMTYLNKKHPVVTMGAFLVTSGVISTITTPTLFFLVGQADNADNAIFYGAVLTSVVFIVTMAAAINTQRKPNDKYQ